MKNAALASVPKHIEHFSKFSPSPLSMKQFLDFGELYVSLFVCMHSEMCIVCDLYTLLFQEHEY